MTSQITIVGNLTGDPELRFTPSGKAVANFTVAVGERHKNAQTNEWEDGESTFYNVSVWNDFAENVAESLQKGNRVVVLGGLKGRSYERREGGKGLSLDITVNNDGAVGPDLKWATAKVTRTQRSGGNGGGAPQGQQGGYAPQGQPADPWAAQGQPQSVPAGGDPWGGAPSDEPPF